MKRYFLLICLVVCGTHLFCQSASVSVRDTSAQVHYAAGVLAKALVEKKWLSPHGTFQIHLVIDTRLLGSESFQIFRAGKELTISGSDATGLLYGCFSLAEDIQNGIPLGGIHARSGHPHYAFRAIKFDLPWDTYRHSDALDLHQETCSNLHFWESFLDMMAQNRFNVLSLWNLHPYPYMIRPEHFPEACPFSDSELQRWQVLFHGILRMAKERGIETYLVPFNIFVSPEFARAHNVAMDNLVHHFFVNGDTSEIIKRYTRECVTQVLREYPELTGFGLTLGEGMAGMTPQQREDWMRETIVEGMRLSGRKTKLIHRIPFSSTTGSLDITSIETEKLTRSQIDCEGALDFIQKPIWADLKYNWSHAHSTPRLIKVHGGKLFDTYFKPEPEVYRITWTARNEDFFCLRWGVPEFIRSHITLNSQQYVGGYFIGSETYIPAKDYFTAIKDPVDWKYAFERQWLFYKLWGRLLYDPSTPDDIFKNEFIRRYGAKAAPLLRASALAGKTPLRLASVFDFTWDFSLYSEGFMALDAKTKSVDYISVDRLINQPVTDTTYLSVKDFVDGLTKGVSIDPKKITPIQLANNLETDCREALNLVANIPVNDNTSLMYEIADIKVWANLGLHFAEKLRGAVSLQRYRTLGNERDKLNAVSSLERSVHYWDEVVNITRPIYRDMPLTHYSEQNGERSEKNKHLLFHWALIRPDVAKDVDIAKNATFKK